MNNKDLEELLKKFREGTLSAEERVLLENWMLFGEFKERDLSEAEIEEELEKLGKRLPIVEKTRRLWPRIAAAAAILLVAGAGLWFYTSRHVILNSFQDPGSAQYANDIAPGKNGATITLSNGQVIALNGAKSGVVVGDALKYSDGSDVRYSSGSSRIESGTGSTSGSLKGSQSSTGPVGVRSLSPSELQGADGKAQILTASTAQGQTYQFILPDGTKVWLNAASSLKFPSAFKGKDRVVALSGEAYMEVAKDKAHPFIVEGSGQVVEVLGTHFNINAYEDHGQVRTTLLEGSVSVRHAEFISASRNRKTDLQGSRSTSGQAVGPDLRQDDDRFKQEAIILKPGQQSILANNSLKVSPADTEETVAWKNGYFRFNNEDIASIMFKLSRWYNIEVKFGELPTVGFYGTISRYKNISEVLEMLEQTKGVHFKIEGRRVTVMK